MTQEIYSFPRRDNCTANARTMVVHTSIIKTSRFLFINLRCLCLCHRAHRCNHIFFFSESLEMLRLDWVLVQLFVFQWPRARNHVKGIEFNWRSVPFDRGFGHLRGGIGLSVLNWVENQLGIRKGASKSFILCNTLSVHQRRQTDIAKDCFLFCRQKKEVCSQNNTQTRHAKSRNNICKMQTYIFFVFWKII